MKHARQDYQRIQDPALTDPSLLPPGGNPIGKDEPVFLLRAQDKHMMAMLTHYQMLLAQDPEAEDGIAQSVFEHRQCVRNWQAKYGCKTPDLPKAAA